MIRVLSLCLGLALVGAVPAARAASPGDGSTLPEGVSVVASGLTNPRGFAWDDDGTLYLALAGSGGPNQVVGDDGTEYPFFNGLSSSVVTIEDGCAVPLTTGLASFLWTDPGWVWGAMDLAFLDGRLYALLSGGGADVGLPDAPNGVYRVHDDGRAELVADLSAWFREHPPAFAAWDYGADGSLFDLEAGGDRLWLSEAVGGRLLTVTPTGEISLIADLSEGHAVPTGVALAPDGGAYVNHETVVPFPDGAATVVHVAPDGAVTAHWTGLTAGTDLTIGPDGLLYAVEMATGNTDEPPHLSPGTGRVVRRTAAGGLEPVVTGLEYPTHLGFGPDGALYLTYPGFAPDAGKGRGVLLRLELAAGTPISLAGVGEPGPSCEGTSAAATTAPSRAIPPEAATEATEGATVTIGDFAFTPPELVVAPGTTVTWRNDDWAPHTVTSGDGTLDSERLDQGAQFEHRFAEPGRYAYLCTYHPGMVGTVVVGGE